MKFQFLLAIFRLDIGPPKRFWAPIIKREEYQKNIGKNCRNITIYRFDKSVIKSWDFWGVFFSENFHIWILTIHTPISLLFLYYHFIFNTFHIYLIHLIFKNYYHFTLKFILYLYFQFYLNFKCFYFKILKI